MFNMKALRYVLYSSFAWWSLMVPYCAVVSYPMSDHTSFWKLALLRTPLSTDTSQSLWYRHLGVVRVGCVRTMMEFRRAWQGIYGTNRDGLETGMFEFSQNQFIFMGLTYQLPETNFICCIVWLLWRFTSIFEHAIGCSRSCLSLK